MTDSDRSARRSAIAAFLSVARRQGYVIVQDALADVGERRNAWGEIEEYPLHDLHALTDLLRERERPPPPAHHGWLRHVPDIAA